MENRPATRENDIYLVISVWKTFYKEDLINFLMVTTKSLNYEAPEWMMTRKGSLHDLPNFESIRRTRQKTQNEEGKFKPSEGTKVARAEAEAQVREWSKQ